MIKASVGQLVEFVFHKITLHKVTLHKVTLHKVTLHEVLERDLEEIVRHKARSAYSRLLVPCIVEHAG
jgi:hypothetical protein